jgi:RNA polymerase sigma-54 factor
MLKQSLGLRLQQKLSPQQIQLMKLIQLSSQALEDRIEEELEENPALEDGTLEQKEETDDWDDSAQEEEAASDDFDGLEDYLTDDDTPDYERSISNYSADDELYEAPIVQTKDMRDILHDQLAMRSLAPQKEALCKYLIGTLEDDGYLRRALVFND